MRAPEQYSCGPVVRVIVAFVTRLLRETPPMSASSYDPFASAYNAHWGPISLQWIPWLAVLVAPRLPSHGRVLDVCCGTGQIAAELSRRGFRMVGLDGSREMLRYARTNAVDAHLVQADVRQFALRSRFDAALCLFDSLNHLLSCDDLAAAFSCVVACLRPGAWFLFDVNTPGSYERNWHGRQRRKAGDHVLRTRSEYDPERRLGIFRASVTRVDRLSQQPTMVTLWQRCHTDAEILAALSASGFGSVEAYSLEHGTLANGYSAHAERAFYLARRRTTRSRS